MSDIVIKSLTGARKAKRRCDALISIEDPGIHGNKRLRFQGCPHPPQLVLRFEDVDKDDGELAAAEPFHVESALEFAREYDTRRLLVHCHAGISRSTAITYAILCDRLGKGSENRALDALFEIRKAACPNLLVTKLADDILGREGRMLSALHHRVGNTPSMQEMLSLRQRFLESHRYEYALRSEATGDTAVLIENAVARRLPIPDPAETPCP